MPLLRSVCYAEVDRPIALHDYGALPVESQSMASPHRNSNTKKPYIGLLDWQIAAVIAALACALLLPNLGNQYLWQDEAETALISRTVLTHGIPMARDATNSYSQFLGGDETARGVSRYHPWFSYYVLAGFFALFGTSTFVCRLPFALFGVATIVLLYFFGKSLVGTRRAGVTASLCLMLSTPFLIMARQCRYYAPEMFFTVLSLYFYHKLLCDGRRAGLYLFVAAMFLFHCHFFMCGTLLVTLLAHSLIWRRDKLKAVLIVCAALSVLNLPWAIYFSATSKYIDSAGGRGMSASAALIRLTRQMLKHVFHPSLIALIPLTAILRWRRDKALSMPNKTGLEKASLPVLFVVSNLIIAAATPTAPWFRVIGPAVPICMLLIAMLVEATAKIHLAPAIAVVAALAFFSPMSQYLYEITHDYDGPVEGIVKYLNAHAKPTDTVVITYDDLPLKFYTKLRVLGGYTGEDLTPAKTADWIILRKCPLGWSVGKYVYDHVPQSEYREITLHYPDIPTENSIEPDTHYYRTAVGVTPVRIAKRIVGASVPYTKGGK